MNLSSIHPICLKKIYYENFSFISTFRVVSNEQLFSYQIQITVEPRFNEVAGDRPNLFVNWRVRYIENFDITNLRGKDQNVRYIEVIVNY